MKEEVLAKKKRAKYLNERFNQYNDLARSTKDIRKWLRKSAVVYWRMDDDDMAECHEEKGDEFFDFADSYEGEAAKPLKVLSGLLDSSDSMICS